MVSFSKRLTENTRKGGWIGVMLINYENATIKMNGANG